MAAQEESTSDGGLSARCISLLEINTAKRPLFMECQRSSLTNVPETHNIETTRPIQSNISAIEHQSFNCRTQSNIIELTIKFCQSNTMERSITEQLVIEPNRLPNDWYNQTFD